MSLEQRIFKILVTPFRHSNPSTHTARGYHLKGRETLKSFFSHASVPCMCKSASAWHGPGLEGGRPAKSSAGRERTKSAAQRHTQVWMVNVQSSSSLERAISRLFRLCRPAMPSAPTQLFLGTAGRAKLYDCTANRGLHRASLVCGASACAR